MSNSVQVHLCILWEDEIKVAARLLKDVHDYKHTDGETSDQAFGDLVTSALNACMTALWSAEDETRPLLLSSASHLVGVRYRRRNRK
jgi:hypothetical protein